MDDLRWETGKGNCMSASFGELKQSETLSWSQRSGRETMFRFSERQKTLENCSLGQMLCEPR